MIITCMCIILYERLRDSQFGRSDRPAAALRRNNNSFLLHWTYLYNRLSLSIPTQYVQQAWVPTNQPCNAYHNNIIMIYRVIRRACSPRFYCPDNEFIRIPIFGISKYRVYLKTIFSNFGIFLELLLPNFEEKWPPDDTIFCFSRRGSLL